MKNIIVILLLVFMFASRVKAEQAYYYFNHPENVKITGCLGNQKIKKNIQTRMFFHFYNNTHKNQDFIIKSDVVFEKINIGYCTNSDPVIAGRDSAINFLKSVEQTNKIDFNIKVFNKHIITVIIQGTPIDDGVIYCCLGDKTNILNNSKIVYMHDYIINKEILCNKKITKVRVGDANTSNHKLGDFGRSILLNIKLNNHKAHISISPRGGGLYFIYKINNIVKSTKRLTVRHVYTIESIHNDVLLEIIPIGGANYPIEITVNFV